MGFGFGGLPSGNKGMPNIFGTLESGSGGPDIGFALKNLMSSSDANAASGRALTDEGLTDFRTISGNYQDLISKGGLTPALNSQYDAQQGQISDDVIRAGRSFRASLTQQAAQGGGYLSPAAQAELAKQGEATTNEQAFTARNQVAFEKAKVSQAATSALQDRVLQIADAIRTTGLTREQQAMMAKLQALGLSETRMKAIMGSVMSGLGGMGGG